MKNRQWKLAFDLVALLIAVLSLQITVFLLITARLMGKPLGWIIFVVELFVLAFPYQWVRRFFRERAFNGTGKKQKAIG